MARRKPTSPAFTVRSGSALEAATGHEVAIYEQLLGLLGLSPHYGMEPKEVTPGIRVKAPRDLDVETMTGTDVSARTLLPLARHRKR